MNPIKKLKAKIKLAMGSFQLHPSYYKSVEPDGLTTAEHIALNDKYMRCFIVFKCPMPEMKTDKRALWVSEDLKAIIGEFTYMEWYNLYLRIGLNRDIAKECTVITSPNHESELKTKYLEPQLN